MNILRILEIFWVIFVTHDYHSLNLVTDGFKVELVQTVFRHGARTPSAAEALFFNVTDSNYYDPYGFGELTDEGKLQNYNLGRLLRRIYKHLVSSTYEPDQVHTFCSSINRTVESMQFAIAGLYSETNPLTAFNSVHCNESAEVLFQSFNDPEFQRLYRQVQHSSVFERNISRHDGFYELVENHTDVSFAKDKDLNTFLIYTAIHVHKDLQKSLPSWVTDDVIKQATELYTLYLNALSSDPLLRRLNGGSMIRSMLENMEDNKEGEMYLYSGHDTNVAALARIFEIEALRLPDYSSAVILEQSRRSDRKKYVRVLYWTGKNKDLGVVRIRDCEEFCPLKKFAKLVNDDIPSDEELNRLKNNLKFNSLNLIK